MLFPYDDVDIEREIETLCRPKPSGLPFLQLYQAENRQYIQILQWKKHQRPHHTEADSQIPPPPQYSTGELRQHNKVVLNEHSTKAEGTEKGMEKGMENVEKLSPPLKNGEVTVRQPLDNGSTTVKEPLQRIFDHWNAQEIVVHKRLSADMKKALEKALTQYDGEQIEQAVNAYGAVLKSSDTFWKYRWGLIEFCQRGIRKFVDMTPEQAVQNFREREPTEGRARLRRPSTDWQEKGGRREI